MGKHDKKENMEPIMKQAEQGVVDVRTVIACEVPTDEYYKQRIKKLESELASARMEAASMTDLYETIAENSQRIVADKEMAIDRKNKEIELAKEAIYRAALREASRIVR